MISRNLEAMPGAWHALSMPFSRRLSACLLLLAAGSGCPSDDTDPECVSNRKGTGELGAGDFVYECINVSDAYCGSGATAGSQFPTAFAVGGSFRLWFHPPEDDKAQQSVLVASSAAILREGPELTVRRPGPQGVYVGQLNAQVTDFIYLLARDPTALNIARVTAPKTYETVVRLATGTKETFEVSPWSEKNELLAGALTYDWRVADKSIVKLTTPGVGGRQIELTPGQPGATQLIAEVDGREFTFPVAVSAGADSTGPTSGGSGAPEDKPAPDSDADMDGGVQ